MTDVLIVGAGMTGLMAARTLLERGYSTRLIDKGRSVGGRMATRRVGERGLADHGAQFFTVRTQRLQRHVDRWIADGLVYIWGTGWSDGSVKPTVSDGHPRYVARGGMNKLAKLLARDLDVVTDRLITRVTAGDDGWSLLDSDGERYDGRALLMTPPMPETLALLSASAISLHPEDADQLRRIHFGSCLCGIHIVAGGIELPAPGAMQNFQSDIYWVADNHAKGISDARIITSHANAKFSRRNWDASEQDIILELESSLAPYMKSDGRVVSTQLKKWRYSVPLTTFPHDHLLSRGLPRLAFAGDAFGGRGRVEGAYLSGIAAGEAIADCFA